MKIDLPDGAWVRVKRYLTAGEHAKMYEAMLLESGKVRGPRIGFAKVVAYLIDWNAVDFDGLPLVIRGEPADKVIEILEGLEMWAFEELVTTIDAHVAAMAEALEEEKKIPVGASGS